MLVGNDDNADVLEMHFPAPQILFESDAVAAICGGDFKASLNEKSVENWRCFSAATGGILKFNGKLSGNRAYLAVRGGFGADDWLGSGSTNLAAEIGGLAGRKLAAGDRLGFQTAAVGTGHPAGRISNDLIPYYRPFPTVRVIKGGEFDQLDEPGRELLCDQDFTISQNSNRMGFRLIGEPISLKQPSSLISSPVSFGTIQLLPDGQLIVLMADHQTAGGYLRIAHVISRDLPLIAQLGAADKVAFHMIEHEEAEKLSIEFELELAFLRVATVLPAKYAKGDESEERILPANNANKR